jgi:hypothetical protein
VLSADEQQKSYCYHDYKLFLLQESKDLPNCVSLSHNETA